MKHHNASMQSTFTSPLIFTMYEKRSILNRAAVSICTRALASTRLQNGVE